MRDASISIAVSSKVVKNLELLSRSEIPKFRKFRISLFRNLTEVLGKGIFIISNSRSKQWSHIFILGWYTYVVTIELITQYCPLLVGILFTSCGPLTFWITRRYLIYELLPSHFLDLAPKFY